MQHVNALACEFSKMIPLTQPPTHPPNPFTSRNTLKSHMKHHTFMLAGRATAAYKRRKEEKKKKRTRSKGVTSFLSNFLFPFFLFLLAFFSFYNCARFASNPLVLSRTRSTYLSLLENRVLRPFDEKFNATTLPSSFFFPLDTEASVA